jgi:hydrogenase/urease accessory protein HupE
LPRRVAGLTLWVALAPSQAFAHAPIEGIEGFYTGLLHPLTTPGQLLCLLALGLLLGLSRPRRATGTWLGFGAAVLAGIVMGQIGIAADVAEPLLFVIAAGATTLAALWPAGRPVTALLLPAIGGLALGLASTPSSGPLRATAITLAGSFVGLNLGLLYAGGAVAWVRDHVSASWVLVGLRIAAAWIAAVAALMAALAMAATDVSP